MPDPSSNSALNDLLILVYRSLLQYTMECWPWSDSGELGEQQAIDSLAAEQQALVARIAELLDQRGVVIDMGTYPDWSELHYVSLDSLLARLIDDEQAMLAAIERLHPALAGDSEGSALAGEIMAAERRHLSKLRDLAGARAKTPVPA